RSMSTPEEASPAAFEEESAEPDADPAQWTPAGAEIRRRSKSERLRRTQEQIDRMRANMKNWEVKRWRKRWSTRIGIAAAMLLFSAGCYYLYFYYR
ncbi:hypothetical protein BOX15_Mlig005847g4, partial [Macrostomum lignano]